MTGSSSPGAQAPGFELPLVGGGHRRLADLVEPGGGVIVFFKDGCPGSELVLPRLNSLAEALAAEGRLLVAVAQEDEGVARAFRDGHGLRFPVAWEVAPYAASAAYGVRTVPTLVVVDGAGAVAERVEGFVKSEYLALGEGLEQALSLGRVPTVLDLPEELPEIKPG